MNYTIPSAIKGVAELLHSRITPEVSDNYAANMARMASAVLNISANWADDAAALRVEENAAIRALLGDCAGLVSGPLSKQLAVAAQSSDPSLRVSQLDTENDRLRRLLVAAQAELEVVPGASTMAIDQRIWRLLEEIETNRAPCE